jgi:hypothetical protein
MGYTSPLPTSSWAVTEGRGAPDQRAADVVYRLSAFAANGYGTLTAH